jgi:hypothetical protein
VLAGTYVVVVEGVGLVGSAPLPLPPTVSAKAEEAATLRGDAPHPR